MLNYQKTILNSISDYEDLFVKELMKSKKWLGSHELEDLKLWLLKQPKLNKYKLAITAILTDNYQIAS
ncbi:hypothetical protein N9901_02920 [Flavobacteriaceae bacterium]|nr:hypothetical protein [Flavobacteriaceae bacterium]